ncbi:MAG: hypothetical protein ABI678_06720 [Kofleriaceae bacterium]
MVFAQLAVVFVGVTGTHHEQIEKQLAPALDKAGVVELSIPDKDRTAIIKHTAASRDIVRKLHVNGLVAGELTGTAKARRFRVVIYDGAGKLESESESPISTKGLEKVDLDVFSTNLDSTLGAELKHPARQQPVVRSDPKHDDSDAPPGLPAQKTVAKVDPFSAPEETPTTTTATAAPASHGGPKLHVRAGLTVGFVGRSLSADAGTILPYNSTPVGTGGFEAGLGIGERFAVTGGYEHTLVMHSDVGGTDITSGIGRWQIAASYDVVHTGFELAPIVGVGGRSFGIDTDTGSRTPDYGYTYAILGAELGAAIGKRVALRGLFEFEPSIGGTQPEVMGVHAARYGLDFGAALEIKATRIVYVRAAFDYQVFFSSWSMVGSATDGYPTGTFAAGAAF